jgi:hypothetical protein
MISDVVVVTMINLTLVIWTGFVRIAVEQLAEENASVDAIILP